MTNIDFRQLLKRYLGFIADVEGDNLLPTHINDSVRYIKCPFTAEELVILHKLAGEEADEMYDAAPADPISEEEIERIVENVTKKSP